MNFLAILGKMQYNTTKTFLGFCVLHNGREEVIWKESHIWLLWILNQEQTTHESVTVNSPCRRGSNVHMDINNHTQIWRDFVVYWLHRVCTASLPFEVTVFFPYFMRVSRRRQTSSSRRITLRMMVRSSLVSPSRSSKPTSMLNENVISHRC